MNFAKNMIIFYCNYSGLVSIALHIKAAIDAPISGPTMKIHKLAKAVPPWKSAGPIERAGLTDVPVYLIQTR